MKLSLDTVKDHGLIAVVRGTTVDNAVQLSQTLSESGIKFIEITVETPGALKVIEKVADEIGDQIFVGAGTVLDQETARSAILAGASYIVSPTLNIDTIKMTKRYGKLSVPGAFSPTEILTAYEEGADAVKVFPSARVGSGYIKDLKGPLPQIPLIATGGIDKNNLHEYLKAGVVAVGLGGSLVNSKALAAGDFDTIAEDARDFSRLFSEFKNA
ncbi:bifunctional 4-hydroxy-2-oxoglutarate aldolase/2-dehydro-3-deoxy-phosphogluconate aldolase [Halalkalibacter flavus]|uniref:bifunctional 4-hydroxy-2-oxoglutarate aldolase/2-dehydro-3-deoxy-phosphogluconate aldolase n=1 Tax=Halalkalibacter flavus TaxID=3090668 RepID=UPI002FCBFF64